MALTNLERKALRDIIKKYADKASTVESIRPQNVPEQNSQEELGAQQLGAQQLADQVAELSSKIAIHSGSIRDSLLGVVPDRSQVAGQASQGPLKDRIRSTIGNLEEISDALFVISGYLGVNQSMTGTQNSPT